MCRYYQLWGWMLIAFGVGELTGLWLEGGFASFLFGFVSITAGCFFLRRH